MSAAPSLSQSCDPAEWAVRVDLAAAYRLVALHGWDDLIFTHLSARVPGTEHFLINPYGQLFEEITASSLVKIDVDGNKVGDSPFPVNPAGFTLHSALHMNRDDAHCVMHLHTVQGQGVAKVLDEQSPITEGDAIPVLLNEVHSFGNDQASDLELLIIGVAREKGKLDTILVK